MTYPSILSPRPGPRAEGDRRDAPACFRDLNLDQIVAAITAGKEEYDLAPFFHAPLHEVEAVAFRHEVFQDLEGAAVFDAINAFARSMHVVRDHLAQLERRYAERQKDRWFLDAVDVYGEGVQRLVRDLATERPRSRGLRAVGEYVARYASSAPFTALVEEGKRLQAALAAIRYSVFIQGPRVEVRRYAGEADYTAEVQATFDRFRQGEVNAYTFRFGNALEMNHVEAQILDGVARLHPETFAALARFRDAHRDFLDAGVVAFDREVQFYIAYLEYIARFRKAGLEFCYPRVSDSGKDVHGRGGFDLALAGKLLGEDRTPVTNDFRLEGPERILVVSGPNQGGKTTFARMFGQLHYLGSLGCPVPGTAARLFLPDAILTHFEREERVTNVRGKLEDDLARMRDILEAATPRTLVIINEIFASTALQDAIALSTRIGAALMGLDVLGVWVTFIDEVASLGPGMVSMVATVVPDNPAQRTFKVVRRPADGLAYAMAIAEKYRLTYEMIKARLGS